MRGAHWRCAPDYDGEERLIQLEVVLDLDIKLYEEESVEILSDVYSPVKELVPITSQEVYESLVIKIFPSAELESASVWRQTSRACCRSVTARERLRSTRPGSPKRNPGGGSGVREYTLHHSG